MDFILGLLVVFVGGGWLLGKVLGNILFPNTDHEYYSSKKEPPTVINNYTTEQHLHISKEDLKSLLKQKTKPLD